MTVDTYTYCAVTDVQAFVGDIVPNRVFSGSTSPSVTDVEIACNMAASLIRAKLAEQGYPLLTNAVLTTTYPLVQSHLKTLNILGACAQILQSVPGMAIDPSDSDAPNTRANQMKKRFDDGIKQLEGQVVDLLGLQRTMRRTAQVTAAQNLDPVTGFHKDPFFYRGMTDIPGSRSLERP